MAGIEQRKSILAKLAGREAGNTAEAAVAASEVRTSLLVISEGIAKSIEETPRSAGEIGQSITTLINYELELFELLGKASVMRGDERQELRANVNELLEKINAQMPALKDLHAERRKEEILASVEKKEETPERPKRDEPARRLRRGGVGSDTLTPLAIERPDLRNTPALRIFEELLVNIESQPSSIDAMISYLGTRLGKSEMDLDPRFKSEAREFVRTLATIREKIVGRGGTAGMTDEQIRADAQKMLAHIGRIKKQAADTLQRIDDNRPIEALPKTNIFSELQNLNRMPYFLGALSSVAQELNVQAATGKLKGVNLYRGNALTRPLNQAAFLGGLGVFATLGVGSFLFSGTGIRNFLINASAYTPYLTEIKAFLMKKEYTIEDIDWAIQFTARILGLGVSATGTAWMLKYRTKVENNPERVKFWIGAIVCIFGALAGIIEKSANALDVVDQKNAADPALDALKSGATALKQQLDDAAKALGAGAEKFVATEAGNGGTGAATMCTAYTYLGRPSPNLLSEFAEFQKSKDPKGDHGRRLEKCKTDIETVNKMPKYAKFGFELGKRGVKQVVEDLVKNIDPSLALAALQEFSRRSEIAGSTTMAAHVLGELDLLAHLGIHKFFGEHDDTLSIVNLKNALSTEFKKLIFQKYEKGLGADIKLLLEYLDDVSEKTGVNLKESVKRDKGKPVGDVLKIESLLKLPTLGITDKHFKDLDAAVGDGAITSAFTLIVTAEGREKLGKAIRQGTPWTNFDENSLGDVAIFVGLMGSLYFGFDVGPGAAIEQMNKAAHRRFRTELGQRFNDAYEVESRISMAVAQYLNASLTAASGFLDEKEFGAAFAVPTEIIAIHVRRKLAEKALREIPEMTGKRRPRGTFLTFLESRLGFDNPYYEPDVQGHNAKLEWLKKIELLLRKNDQKLLDELISDIAPQYRTLKESFAYLEKASILDRGIGRGKELLEKGKSLVSSQKAEARKDYLTLRRHQLELIVKEIPAQIAILRATQRRIRATTSPDDDKPLVLGTTGKLRVTPEYIKSTFLFNQIGNDIWRYETALRQARDMGIHVESALDISTPLFKEALEKDTDMQWEPSTAPEQAMLDQLIEANARRFLSLSAESDTIDFPAFEKYMNTLNTGIIPLLHDFNARMPYLASGRKDIAIVYDREDDTGRALVSVKLLDTPRGEGSDGIPEVVASVPFEDRPIPDFSNDRATPKDALKALGVWLAPGGDVMTTMRAHIQKREIGHLLGDFERKLLSESSDMRFDIREDMAYVDRGSAGNRFEDFAVLKNLRARKEEVDKYFSEIDYQGKTVDVKHIDPDSATAIAAIFTDARNAVVGSQRDARQLQTAAAAALKNLPPGAKLVYDAKMDEPTFVIVRGTKEDAFSALASPAEIASIVQRI